MTRRLERAATIAVGGLLGVGLVVGSAAGLSLTSQALTVLRTCTVTATPATTTAVSDTSVRQGAATTNFGTATALDVASGNNLNRRTYLRFDLTVCSPAIPAGAVIRLATLRLFMSAVPGACRTIDIFRVTAAWTEAAITWNNQPFGTAINNPATAARTDSFGAGTPVGCENTAAGYVLGAVVTADVGAFTSGAATNNGWMLRDDAEGSATLRTTTFSAKNLGTVTQAPQLIVTYVAP